MNLKKALYNPELDTTEIYTEVWKPEIVKVRDINDLLVINHYWQDADGELWGDFADPMENVRNSFTAYRKRKNYMTSGEIRELRHNLGLSVREFAYILGIGSSSLTQIENNQRVQAKYQEILFEAARNDYNSHHQLPDNWRNDFEKPLASAFDNSPTYSPTNDLYTTKSLDADPQSFGKSSELGGAA